jgi:exopolysaccharide biosynthesis operon protein EpsL
MRRTRLECCPLFRQGPSILAFLSLFSFGVSSVWAQETDGLKLRLTTSLVHDSNVFRLSDTANVKDQVGRDSAADIIANTSLGISLKQSYSLQRFEFEARIQDYRYQNFGNLSISVTNYLAAWRWSLTPRITGNASVERKEVANDFTGIQGDRSKNKSSVVTSRLDGTYEVSGPWWIVGGIARVSESGLQNQGSSADVTSTGMEAGLRYNLASGSSIGYLVRNTKGNYVNRQLPSADFLDDRFSQLDHGVNVRWSIDGSSSADLRATQLKRSHPNYAQRDYDGTNLEAGLNLAITGKTSLALGWGRDLASLQTGTSNYTQTDRLTITPVWQVSPKTQLLMRHEMGRQSYLGNPSGAPSPTIPRVDTLNDTLFSLNWQPYTFAILSLGLRESLRSSNVLGQDFQSTQATVSAQFIY